MRPTRSMRFAPMTVGLVWISCALFIGTYYENGSKDKGDAAEQFDWGQSLPKTILLPTGPEGEMEPVEDLHGPFDLWDGDWYRVIIGAFHHGGLFHLIGNGWVLLYLGRIIEPRMSRLGYLCFFMGSAAVAAIPDALAGHYAIGLSGVGYAMFGLLLVWRDRDEEVAKECPYSLVILAGISLVGGQLLTYAEVLPIANMAHYTGLIYGWVWGQAFQGAGERTLFRFLFSVSHFALIPAFWLIVNPFWSGAWHYYQAYDNRGSSFSDDAERRRRIECLQAAVVWDPSLDGAWLKLSEYTLLHSGARNSLRVAMEGLKQNRNDPELMDFLVDLWSLELKESEREAANQIIEQVFEDEAAAWNRILHREVDPVIARMRWQNEDLARLTGPLPFEAEPALTLVKTPFQPEDPEPIEFDPDAPDSALGGQML